MDYTYDVMGRVTGIKYPTGKEVTYEYNSLGELTGMPGYLTGAPTYDQGGLLTGLTAANGITMTRSYDQNARLQNLGYKDPQAALKEYQYTYDGANNIIQRNNDQFQYDALNQLIFARLQEAFEIGPENDDQRQGRTLEDYYGNKQLEFNLSPEILELDYAAGSIGVDLRGEFPVTRVELTPESPVHRVKPRHLAVYVSIDNYNYTEVKNWEAATGAGGKMVITFATPVTTRFIKVQCQFDERDHAYRPVNRAEFKHRPEELIKVYYTITSRYEEYVYDAAGNRVQERITLRITETRNYSYYPNSNRLLTNGVYGFVYDANGNLIRKGTSFTITGDGIELKDEGEYWEYRYDLLNRLTEVKKNGVTVAKYSYDETGLRVKKESGDGTIYYVFNLEGQVLYEEENREYVEYIYLLGRHFARVDGYRTATTEERTTYFYHTDHLGSTVLVTDETGATVWSTEYTPFGSLTFEEGKLKRAVKFTGKDLDEDTGLYYFNARWYDQSIGRFISEDPIKDGLNWYTYAANNPLRFVDPTGLSEEPATLKFTPKQGRTFWDAARFVLQNSERPGTWLADQAKKNPKLVKELAEAIQKDFEARGINGLKYGETYELYDAGYYIPRLAVKNNASASNATRRVVLIDAGHGGRDPGTVNTKAGLLEKTITLSVASMVQSKLQENNIDVAMTRTTDTYLHPNARWQLANSLNAEIFVSLHVDMNANLQGGHIIIPKNHDINESMSLAQCIVSNFGKNIRLKKDPIRKDDRGLTVLRNTNMPAVIVELGFIGGDADLLSQESYLSDLASGIALGIIEYLRNED